MAQTTRWRIAILLGFGVLVSYFDRVNLSVAHGELGRMFAISDVTFGYLLSAYSWTYAAMQLPAGALLDRWGVRRVLLVATLLWAMASGLAALAPTIALLFAARFLLGIGESPTFPANSKAIGEWFPPELRGKPTAVFDAAAKLSIGIGTPMVGLIGLRWGLRANFGTTAVLSLLFAGVFAFVYRDPARPAGPVPGVSPTASVAFGDLLRQRKVWGLAIGSGAYNYCFYLLLTWLPVYLQTGAHLSAHNAFLVTGIPWIAAAILDFLVGGWLIDALIHRGRNPDRVRRSVLIGGTTLGLFIAAPAFTHQPTAVIVCLSLALSGLAAAAPVIWSIPSLLAPASGTGRLAAIVNLVNQFAAISAPIVTGYILTARHSFAGAFLVSAALLVVGIASYVVLLGKIEEVL